MTTVTKFVFGESLPAVLARINQLIDKTGEHDAALAAILATGLTAKAIQFEQRFPSRSWNIAHDFPRIPSVSVFDSSGRQVFPDITVVNSTHIRIDFSGASDGTAILT